MPLCPYCNEDRPEESFEVCRIINGKVYRRRKCQVCKRITTNERIQKNREWLREYKRGMRCERCGFDDFRALHFHHTDRDSKRANVADMLRSALSLEAIRREIAKCQVLCSNCHDILHYEEWQEHNAERGFPTTRPRCDDRDDKVEETRAAYRVTVVAVTRRRGGSGGKGSAGRLVR